MDGQTRFLKSLVRDSACLRVGCGGPADRRSLPSAPPTPEQAPDFEYDFHVPRDVFDRIFPYQREVSARARSRHA
jgi:hypothetical protein